MQLALSLIALTTLLHQSNAIFDVDTIIRKPAMGSTQWQDTTRLPNGSWTLTPEPKTNTPTGHGRKWLVAGAHAAVWGASYYTLNQTWYNNYPRSGFHCFNDNREWLQMDKAGHLWTAYQMSRLSGQAWQWAGFSQRQAAWLGGISGVAYQSIIEIQDGLSAEWGFSWGDMTANIVGSALYVVQELTGGEQKWQIKFSYHPYPYSADLKYRRNASFGNTLSERMLKDYNSQTYWLSANLRSLLPASRLPKWLNFSLGYSGKGMFGAVHNTWVDKDGLVHDRSDIRRTRHVYLSADVDLTKIKTNNRLLRTVLYVLNAVKIPAPTIEFSRGKIYWHWIYY
ncbi:DUF2279 domain-containing protein [Paraflavitalea pollutisoli]|uniref:DUF2279 domain-containing protein n=1 Tax=Paraflavitalea pollutisoli TaxID=3034143 RepID=UPI0023ECB73D|nr:DUF2279 domain-containing protein [Paraflavitalea sp. H1-2-19X]